MVRSRVECTVQHILYILGQVIGPETTFTSQLRSCASPALLAFDLILHQPHTSGALSTLTNIGRQHILPHINDIYALDKFCHLRTAYTWASHKMPSPRSSPVVRPTSPLSPRYEPPRYESLLQPPSPRALQSRPNSARRRNVNTSLRLPSLPRFHPANFPSAHSSYQSTPDDAGAINAPLSPRTHQKMYSDAQKQLLIHHREHIAAARAHSPSAEKPNSPRLAPLGSPGPVTPLELEGDGYLVAGAETSDKAGASHQELIERLIREEARRAVRTSQSPNRQLSTGRS